MTPGGNDKFSYWDLEKNQHVKLCSAEKCLNIKQKIYRTQEKKANLDCQEILIGRGSFLWRMTQTIGLSSSVLSTTIGGGSQAGSLTACCYPGTFSELSVCKGCIVTELQSQPSKQERDYGSVEEPLLSMQKIPSSAPSISS